MKFVGCSVPERFVNPLFEVFDGGDFALSSSRDIEESLAVVRVYLPPDSPEGAAASAAEALSSALAIVGCGAAVEEGEIADEDWKFAYRRHFRVEEVGRRLVLVPAWEKVPEGDRIPVVLDPGMAFGTGRHETTRSCLEFIDGLFAGGAAADGAPGSFLDMGCGSGILSIAAAKLGCRRVEGFDVDPVAVETATSNAAANGVSATFRRFALGRRGGSAASPYADAGTFDLVAANILGPLLVRFADEIVPFAGRYLVISGILSGIYGEVLGAYLARGFSEVERKTAGEWTSGLLARSANMV